jgi:spermidine/putrescine transport system permease protein
MLRGYAIFAYLFLYAPIALIVLLSFNSGNNASDFQGFGVNWYFKAANNRLMLSALQNSLIIAFTSSVLATVMGTMTAHCLAERVKGPVRVLFDLLTYVAIMVPGIVIGISPRHRPGHDLRRRQYDPGHHLAGRSAAQAQPRVRLDHCRPHAVRHGAGHHHRARAHCRHGSEPHRGLGRSLRRSLATFRQVTLPQLMPGIVAGFLLSFTFSFDDFVIAFFVAGSKNTLPIYVFSSIRRGVTPEINAIGTAVMLFSLTALITAQVLLRRGSKQGR